MTNEFASEFAFTRLYPLLKGLDAANDQTIRWYWGASRHWSALSQESFNRLAERRVRDRVEYPFQLRDDEQSWLALFDKKYPTVDLSSRRIRRETPISQIKALSDGEGGTLLPWDYKPACRAAGSEEGVYAVIAQHEDRVRRQIVAQFRKERPEDYAFIVDYLATKGKRAHETSERRRAKRIIDRLRRIEQTEWFPEQYFSRKHAKKGNESPEIAKTV